MTKLPDYHIPEVHILQTRPLMSPPPAPLTVPVHWTFICWGELWGVTPWIAKDGKVTDGFAVTHIPTGMGLGLGPARTIKEAQEKGEEFLDKQGIANILRAIDKARLAISQGRVL